MVISITLFLGLCTGSQETEKVYARSLEQATNTTPAGGRRRDSDSADDWGVRSMRYSIEARIAVAVVAIILGRRKVRITARTYNEGNETT